MENYGTPSSFVRLQLEPSLFDREKIESCPGGVFSLQIQNSNTHGFFKVMEPSINAPFVSTQADGSTATQVDGSTATQADGATTTQEVAVATLAEAIDAELPPVPPSKVKTGTSNGRKKFLVWNHFEKVKVDEGVMKAICNYCKKIISC
ncbi:uncharacterized protein LOC126701054 [Quercus robur]|uniref:uncharacterized protein LOC126701054 n=1 Tax=Quercus robur TaxID=38942 RepID=UPI0021626DEB|nr:uncharacterized protein LOC126701054 [Quercus robur]